MPNYNIFNDEVAQRYYANQRKQHDSLMLIDPSYRQYQEELERKRQENEKMQTFEENRTLWDRLFDRKPASAELDETTAIQSDFIDIGNGQRVDRRAFNMDVDYGGQGSIRYWEKETLNKKNSDRGRKWETLKLAGQNNWDKGTLKNIRYNYDLLRANGRFEEAEQYLDNIVNQKFKLINTKNLPTELRNQMIDEQKQRSGQDYDNINVSPQSMEAYMQAALPNYREFKDDRNYRGEKYIDFTADDLVEIGNQWKDILRLYGQNDAYNFLYNTVQKRIADNTHFGQRIIQNGYAIATDAIGMVATIGGMVGDFLFDWDVYNNSSYNPNASWWANKLQGTIDNQVTRWANDLTTYQAWSKAQVSDDARQMGSRLGGMTRAAGDDIFNNPALFFPEAVRILGMVLGTQAASAIGSGATHGITSLTKKAVANAVKNGGVDITKKSMSAFIRKMDGIESTLNVVNAGIIAMGEGTINSLQTHDQTLASGYMQLAESLGLNPNQNTTPEQIARSLTEKQILELTQSPEVNINIEETYKEFYEKNLKDIEGYSLMIRDRAMKAAQTDFLMNAAINGPIYMTMTQGVFNEGTRRALRGSRLNLENNKRDSTLAMPVVKRMERNLSKTLMA